MENVNVDLTSEQLDFIESKAGDNRDKISLYISRLISEQRLKEGNQPAGRTEVITYVWGGPSSLGTSRFFEIYRVLHHSLNQKDQISSANGFTKIFIKNWNEEANGERPDTAKINELSEAIDRVSPF